MDETLPRRGRPTKYDDIYAVAGELLPGQKRQARRFRSRADCLRAFNAADKYRREHELPWKVSRTGTDLWVWRPTTW